MFTDPEVVRYVGGLQTADEVEADMPTNIKRLSDAFVHCLQRESRQHPSIPRFRWPLRSRLR